MSWQHLKVKGKSRGVYLSRIASLNHSSICDSALLCGLSLSKHGFNFEYYLFENDFPPNHKIKKKQINKKVMDSRFRFSTTSRNTR